MIQIKRDRRVKTSAIYFQEMTKKKQLATEATDVTLCSEYKSLFLICRFHQKIFNYVFVGKRGKDRRKRRQQIQQSLDSYWMQLCSLFSSSSFLDSFEIFH